MNQFQATSETMIANAVQFLKTVYKNTNKKNGLIAVSGGIDSAVSLTLLVKALGKNNVHAVLLPYDTQDMADAQTIVQWNQLPKENIQTIHIKPVVDGVVQALKAAQVQKRTQATQLPADSKKSTESQPAQVSTDTTIDHYRLGNIMARARMIILFDQAKKLDALVCGTENKSEKYLGYFTRFGDEASDIEPIQGFYKTQIRELAEHLQLPEVFLKKSPSAGLWKDQTDETELGFSYQTADAVFEHLIDEKSGLLYMKLIEGNRLQEVTQEIHAALPDISPKTIEAVLRRVQSQQFKHEVPYTTESNY